MTNDLQLGSLYILMAVMLIAGMLISRRGKFATIITVAIAWLAIFGAGFVVFTFRDDLSYVAQRLTSEATGKPVEQAGTIRVPMAIDGHFWVEGRINGVPANFLVDSGATMTTIGRDTAVLASLDVSRGRNQLVRTGNGVIRVAMGRAKSLNIGSVERRDVAMHVADHEDLNVLGMNYLSTLNRWGVEGRWLILEP
jgi:aspartyl protease family protein